MKSHLHNVDLSDKEIKYLLEFMHNVPINLSIAPEIITLKNKLIEKVEG